MLVAALERHGLRTLQFPLLDIAPTPNLDDLRAALADPSRYALVVFVSPNAVQQAFSAMPEGFRWPQDVPVAVVGSASAQVLAAHGVEPPTYRVILPDSHADEARQDSEALYARLDLAPLSGREMLIVRGNGGREWLADRLREAGVAVRTVEAYRRSVPVPDAATWAALREVLAGRHAWTLTSSEAVRNLDSLARASLTAAEVDTLHAAPCFAPHARIVEQAQSLGFHDVTLTGAGDDRLLAGLLAWAGPVAPAAEAEPSPAPAAAPAESKPSSPAPTVSQTSVPSSVPAPGPAAASPGSAAAPAAPTMTVSAGPGRGNRLLWVALILVLVVVAGLQVRNERLAREVRQRAQQNETLAQEMRVLSRADQDAFAQLQQKFGALDARTAETRERQGTLEQASQDLLRNRDDWQRAEIERSLEVASEQLQLTGNVSAALAALQTIDARLAALDKPQFRAMRRAVARDIAKLKALPAIDLSGASIRLDDAINGIDALPLVSSASPPGSGQAAQASRGHPAKPGKAVAAASASTSTPSASAATEAGWSAGARAWWSRLWHDVRSELGQIVQVRRVDQTEALLLSSDQAWFLRENLKLWLMNARLALLSRNEAVFRADLGRADTLLARYFDMQSPRVAAVQNLLQQARASVGTLEVPTLADSLAAVRGQGKE
ncbi:hypothetical protein ACEQUB_02412 [Ralstonia syzygii]